MTQIPLEFGHQPSYAADDYLVADGNAEAFAWLERWPDWGAPGLVIHGPAGCGKTHLVHLWRARADAILLAPADLARADAAALLGDAACCALDGLNDGIASAVAERTALHLHNMVAERRGQMLICAATPPARWRIDLPDLRSRLLALPIVAIRAPDDLLLRALVVKLFHDRQIGIDDEIANFIVARMERSFDGARRLVEAIDRAALTEKRRLTAPLIRKVVDSLGETTIEE